MRSFLGVPIIGRRGMLGNLYLTEKNGGESFTDEDEDLAILLAAKTAAAIENARHHEESARLLEEVQQLQRRARAVLRDGEPRAPERAGGGLRMVGDAGTEEGSGDGPARGVRSPGLGTSTRSA